MVGSHGVRNFAPLPADRSALTDEQIAAINAKRSPSERVSRDAFCGARLSDNVKKKLREKGKEVGDFCTYPAGMGTSHKEIGYCKFHGGNTPAGKKSAARVLGRSVIQEQKREMMLMSRDNPDRFGGNRHFTNITPEEALLEEVRRSVAMVRWLEDRIGEWRVVSPGGTESDSPPTDRVPGTPDTNLGGLPVLMAETSRGNASFTDEREWMLLYREERAHMTRVSKIAIDAGIAERMVSIAEDQGRILAVAVKRVLEALNLSPKQASIVPQVVPNILREVSRATTFDPTPTPSPFGHIATPSPARSAAPDVP